MEKGNELNTESDNQLQEVIPANFSVIEDKGDYYFDRKPDLKEGEVIHYMKSVGLNVNESKKNCFALLKTISGLHYVFSLSEATLYGQGVYQLSFKTEEYEFATTDLDDNARNLLFSTISGFVESCSQSVPDSIKEIRISPADASYSAEEIDQCTEEVLASPKNTLTREELASEYKGFKIFDLYQQLFEKNFHTQHYNWKSRARGRSRLFKATIGKYFPNWEVSTDSSLGSDFSLKRKI